MSAPAGRTGFWVWVIVTTLSIAALASGLAVAYVVPDNHPDTRSTPDPNRPDASDTVETEQPIDQTGTNQDAEPSTGTQEGTDTEPAVTDTETLPPVETDFLPPPDTEELPAVESEFLPPP